MGSLQNYPHLPVGCIIQLVYVMVTNKSFYIHPAGELIGKLVVSHNSPWISEFTFCRSNCGVWSPLGTLKELNLLKLQECENKFKILDSTSLFGWQQQNKIPLKHRQKLGAQRQTHIFFAPVVALVKLSCNPGETLICHFFEWFGFDGFQISFIRGNCYYLKTNIPTRFCLQYCALIDNKKAFIRKYW